MIPFASLRRFLYQHPDGNVFEVTLRLQEDGTIDGVGKHLGCFAEDGTRSEPAAPAVSFVVLTGQANVLRDHYHHTRLAQGAYFHATDREGPGVPLSTILALTLKGNK